MRLFKDKLFRNIFISVVLLAILGGAYYAVMNMPEDNGEAPESTPSPEISSNITVFESSVDDMEEIHIKNENSDYIIVSEKIKEKDSDGKETEKTVYKIKNSNIDYSSAKLQSQCYNFVNISALKELENESEEYGLSAPAATAEVRLKNGSAANIAIGNKVLGGSGYFAKINDKIYNVSEYFAESVLKSANDFRDKEIAVFDMSSMKKLNITKSGECIKIRPIEDGEISKFSKMTAIIMTEPKYISVSADYINKISEKITGISVSEFVSDNSEDFAKYGLSSPSMTFEFADGATDITVHYGDKTEDGEVYANIDGKNTIFTTDASLYDTLYQVTAEALADKLCNLVHIDDIKSVTVSGGGKEYTFSVKGKDDKMKYYLNGKSANEESFKKAYQAIIGVTSNGFAEKEVSGDAEYTVTYKYKDGTEQTAKYINYDERNYVLDLGGNREFIVLKKKLADMMQSLDAFAKDPAKKPIE